MTALGKESLLESEGDSKMKKIMNLFKWTLGYVVALNCIWLPFTIHIIFGRIGLELDQDKMMFYLAVSILLGNIVASVCYVMSMVCLAIDMKKNYKQIEFVQSINKLTLLVKIGSIPYFIINFLGFGVFACVFANPFLLAFVPIVISIGVIAATIVLIMTSCYSILTYIIAGTNQIISKKCCIRLVCTQCIFVIDIIGVIIGTKIFRKRITEEKIKGERIG